KYLTWSCAYALDPHIRFFRFMFSFQGTYLSSDVGVYLLPYRGDLYIIPLVHHYVNTFFVTFLTFFAIRKAALAKKVLNPLSFTG
ncbi:hypothetical protein, partial [uncultured Phascolarctobacterium sp.]|uniref:hypothetical protein n=1 Tax=uncultured Phascolarctobacterium sp. TaxID=512296 RepID=UPI0027D980DC